uniref:hypothetical protein n=1 Tax=Mycobacterium simiae TaxID=1784 RepID=UPI00358E9186
MPPVHEGPECGQRSYARIYHLWYVVAAAACGSRPPDESTSATGRNGGDGGQGGDAVLIGNGGFGLATGKAGAGGIGGLLLGPDGLAGLP